MGFWGFGVVGVVVGVGVVGVVVVVGVVGVGNLPSRTLSRTGKMVVVYVTSLSLEVAGNYNVFTRLISRISRTKIKRAQKR